RHDRVAGFTVGQSGPCRRRALGLAAQSLRGRGATLAGFRRHDTHGVHDRERARIESIRYSARGRRFHRHYVDPTSRKLRAKFYAHIRLVAGKWVRRRRKKLSGKDVPGTGYSTRYR